MVEIQRFGNEFRVNGTIRDVQSTPSLAVLEDGGFVVAWTDWSGIGDTSRTGILAQTFNADGVPRGSELRVNLIVNDAQQYPAVAALTGGGFVVVYEDAGGFVAGGTDVNISMSIFAADGTPVVRSARVNADGLNRQNDAAVAGLEGGGFVVVWEDYSLGLGDNSGASVKGRLFDASGQPIGSDFRVNTTTAGAQWQPNVTALAGGGFVASWTDGESIVAQLFDATATRIGGEITVASRTDGALWFSTGTALAGGGFVLAWQEIGDANTSTDFNIRARVFDASGVAAGAAIEVNTSVANGQTQPDVAALPGGGFIVTWTDDSRAASDTSGTAIRARAFNADGTEAVAEFVVNAETAFGQSEPSIGMRAKGRLAVAWTNADGAGAGGDGNASSIKAQLFSVQDTPLGGVLVTQGQVVTRTAAEFEAYDRIVAFEGAGQDTVPVALHLASPGSLDLADKLEGRRAASVQGSAGGDTLIGSALADTLIGGGGDDSLMGMDGDDLLRGGAGRDTLDGGFGLDTVDYSTKTAGVSLVLPELFVSGRGVTIGGALEDSVRNVENAIGGSAADRLTGNTRANHLSGLAGHDVLDGDSGDDTLVGGAGGDTLRGGDGIDLADFSASTVSISVTLGGDNLRPVRHGSGDVDQIAGVENLLGGRGNDTLFGDALPNVLSGGDGADLLAGRGGADTLDGGAGVDLVDYEEQSQGIIVNLLGATFSTAYTPGNGGIDLIRNVEDVNGGGGNDAITGDGNANRLRGYGGDDSLMGGNGRDVLDGGAGWDVASFADKSAQVLVALVGTGRATVFVAGAEEDTLIGIEGVIGGAGNDRLTGDDAANLLAGGGGADTLSGGRGADTLDGGDFRDRADYALLSESVRVTLAGDGPATVFIGGQAEDVLLSVEEVFTGGGADTLVGDAGANHLAAQAGDDWLVGGLGADTLDGGLGTDTVSYLDRADPVVLRLFGTSFATATVGGVAEDRVRNVENIRGGSGNDRLTGDALGNRLAGNEGSDILNGRGGNDTLSGEEGRDIFVFDTAPDGATNRDVVMGFEAGLDIFLLDTLVFPALSRGLLDPAAFATGPAATTTAHRIIHDPATFSLSYDPDGSDGAAAVSFAMVSVFGTLGAGDFIVV
jgi:Ca2+-binding RTX toxin-like protein